MAAKRKLPAAFKANAARMKRGENLIKKGGRKGAKPRNVSKRKK
jgi:hypothetical protein